ncbi:hypothetical protein ABI59_10815 [Acidobacteria bacterium Mor1]|nr:hypothetical protein ABI59_10815 [Acidobacteria bacterium Mor1]
MSRTKPESREPEAVSFPLPAGMDEDALFDLLASHFAIAPTENRQESWDYFDTFDWRLYRRTMLLAATRGESGRLLQLGSLDGAPLEGVQVAAAPGFVWDLPEGPLRHRLEPVLEMRRLLRVVSVRVRARGFRILDGNRKTVVWADVERVRVRGHAGAYGIEKGDAELPLQLRLTAVRGYDRALSEVVVQCSRVLEADQEQEGDLSRVLASVGARPGAYASKPALDAGAEEPASTAIPRLLLMLRRTIEDNLEGTLADVDSEFLHDLRVAVRRTRTCLGQFKELWPAPTLERAREFFSWVGQVTGPTRDLDVYMLNLPDYRRSLPAAVRPHLAPLETLLEERRQREQRSLRRKLRSRRFREEMAWWEQVLADPAATAEAANTPIGELAGQRTLRRFERVMRRGAKARASRPQSLHDLRIDCKKLRYLLEFFAALYDPEHLKPAVRALKRLQDNLGRFNDLEVQQAALAGWAGEMTGGSEAGAEPLLAMGRLLERLDRSQKKELQRFADCFAEFSAEENRKHFRRMLQP